MATLKHQDGDIEYEVERCGYWIDRSRLYISIMTKAHDPEAFPDRYYFAVDGFELTEGLESGVIEISTNPEDQPPNVYVYTTFHACDVDAKQELEILSGGEVELHFSIFSEDVNYYDERAKRNEFTGSIRLADNGPDGLWMPA